MKSYAVAVTGGIGSGKSAVMRILEACGEKTVYADNINRELLNNPDYIKKLSKLFPNVITNEAVDKRLLAETVFSDNAALASLNALAHPEILKAVRSEIAAADGVLFAEIPLMNAEIAAIFDEIWRVDADESVRAARAAARDCKSERDIRKIAEAQKSCDYAADFVIENNGSLEQLEISVKNMLKALKERLA